MWQLFTKKKNKLNYKGVYNPLFKKKKKERERSLNNKIKMYRANPIQLKFRKMTENAYAPTKGSARAAGFDLRSAYETVIPPQQRKLILTDLQMAIPTGYYGRIAPRSGLALHYGIQIGAGVIDEDYRGNIAILLFNTDKENFKVYKGHRIAQIICEKICYPQLVEVQDLDATRRDTRGFGSTGNE